MYENQVRNGVKNFAGDEQEKRKVNRRKYGPYSLGECEIEESLCKVVSTLPHSISLWTSWRELVEFAVCEPQWVEFRGILFSNVELRSGSFNSFSVQDPFGSHYSSEEENIDKGIAEDQGLLGNRFCQAQASCRYFTKLIGIFKALRWLFTESTTSHRLKPDYNHQSFQ